VSSAAINDPMPVRASTQALVDFVLIAINLRQGLVVFVSLGL